MQFHTIFTQFWLFQPFLGQFLHVGYQNACTRAEKFIGNTFKKFHARVHAISRNFRAIWTISAIFGQISTCWLSKHGLKLRNSLVILVEAKCLKKGLKAPIMRPKASKGSKGPNKEAKSLLKRPKPPRQSSAGVKIYGATCHNIQFESQNQHSAESPEEAQSDCISLPHLGETSCQYF